MLQTCTRCRSRRIKCDSLLPACANCTKSDVECTIRDHALQEDIPRSYIKSLNDRIEELSSQLALQSSRPATFPDSGHTAAGDAFHVLMPGPGKDLYLDLSLPSRIARVTFEVLAGQQNAVDISLMTDDGGSAPPNLLPLDRSLLTPGTIRFLLNCYDRCIRPQYNILLPEVLNYDGMNLQKLPDLQKFKILMACATAAARESYYIPNWKPLAQLCRDWAADFITPIILPADIESLTAILLLLVYELVDPSRGSIWELLDLAMRTCLQQGWHRTMTTIFPGLIPVASADNVEVSTCNDTEFRLLSILGEIEGSLRTIFCRPTMLSGSKWPSMSHKDSALMCYEQLYNVIYADGKIYDGQQCPFVGDIVALIDLAGNLSAETELNEQIWLLTLPICVKHKQCVFCFQEDDDTDGKGMRTLRKSVVEAASRLVSLVYHSATTRDGFIPPFIAGSRILIAGCTIAVGIFKKWTTSQLRTSDLIKCTEVLSLFAPHWKGGQVYLQVWRSIVAFLDIPDK